MPSGRSFSCKQLSFDTGRDCADHVVFCVGALHRAAGQTVQHHSKGSIVESRVEVISAALNLLIQSAEGIHPNSGSEDGSFQAFVVATGGDHVSDEANGRREE